MKRLLLSASLALALFGASPAQADFIEDHYKVFEAAMREAAGAFGANDVKAAAVGVQKARQAVRQFESDAVTAKQDGDPQVRKAHSAMRVDLIRLLTALGEGYYESKDYAKALECYQQAIEVEPELPLSHHYAGFMHLALGQKEQAQQHLYEAKRLNRLPHMRWLVNPFDESFRIGAETSDLDQANDGLLAQNDLSLAYPIEREAGGKVHQAVMVPGVGANLKTAAKGYANLYFSTPLAKVIEQIGPAVTTEKNVMLIVQFGGQTTDPNAKPKERALIHYAYPASHTTVSIDRATQQVYMIQSEDPGFSVRIGQDYLAVGDTEAKVQQLLGTGYGFQAYELDGAGVKKMFLYPGLGLVIGMGADGKIAALNIQNLE